MTTKLKSRLQAVLLPALLLSATGAFANTIQVTDNITNTTTWFSTNEYVLNAKIYVLSNVVLNIEPGTVIRGKPPTPGDTNGNTVTALIITRDAKIYANGSRTKPIIFTAEADDLTDPGDLGIYQRGLWGGLVLLGNTTINTSLNTTGNSSNPKYDVFEGLPDLQINDQNVHRYGGNNDDDNSGVLHYVSIRHAGFKITTDKELNGLTLAAVGRGTTIDHVEIYAAADDGVEFFGGTVNTKYMVSAFNDDDCFDVDQGYRGKNQFWFAIQEPGTKDNGGEWNGDPKELVVSNTPLANFEVYNATWIGAGTNTTGNRGWLVRDYSAPKVHNSIITDFGGFGINVDPDSGWFLTNGLIQIDNNIWWKFRSGMAETANAQVYVFDDASKSNLVVDPLLRGVNRSNVGLLDPRPQTGSPALTSPLTAPNDGFYTPVNYKGAFDANENWLYGWTALDAYGFLPPTTTLTITPSGGNLLVAYPSQSGHSYQLRSATNGISPVFWVNEGGALSGTGGTLTNTVPLGPGVKFFRVEVQ